MNLTELRRFVDEAHGRQQYGNNNYIVHLEEVRDVLNRFHFTIEAGFEFMHQAAYLHDVFEDTDFTPELAGNWGIDERAIQAASDVSDGDGPTRKERKIAAYKKINTNANALVLKLADRIANVESGGKLDMYKEEHAFFRASLHNDSPHVTRMWEHLDNLLK